MLCGARPDPQRHVTLTFQVTWQVVAAGQAGVWPPGSTLPLCHLEGGTQDADQPLPLS